ncbi:MAG: hypothetical protein FJ096_21520, partial [Deltaproteobacteria bacterium]|nr:hypothetical protein [Deltaproteobacteria bacterium]
MIDLKFKAGASVALAMTLTTPMAAAQDVAAAEALFNKGLEAMNQGRLDEACPKLEESHRLDPRPGGLFTLAECENKRGRIATASARYEEYLRLAASLAPAQRDRQKDRIAIATTTQAAIAKKVPKLRLRVTPLPIPTGVVITRDGLPFGAGAVDEPIPVDPGDHVIVVKQPSGKQREFKVSLAASENRTLHVDATLEATGPAPAPASETAAAANPDAATTSSSGRTLGIAVGSIGVVGLVAGAVTGGLALAAKGVVDDN